MSQYKNDLLSPNKLYPLIGKNIKRLRQQRDMTQEQLAELIDGNQKYISKIEAGKARPGLAVYLRIANIFQVSIDYFLSDAIEAGNSKEIDAARRMISPETERKLAQDLMDTIFQYLQEKE